MVDNNKYNDYHRDDDQIDLDNIPIDDEFSESGDDLHTKPTDVESMRELSQYDRQVNPNNVEELPVESERDDDYFYDGTVTSHLDLEQDVIDDESDSELDSGLYLEDDEQDEDEPLPDEINPKEKWLIRGVIALTVIILLGFGGFMLRNAFTNFGDATTEQVYEGESAVNGLFGEDGKIKARLKAEEVNVAREYVENLDEGTVKIELRLKVSQAEEQLEEQTKAERLVSDITKDGRPYIDINDNSLVARAANFPTNYNTEYARQLSDQYNTAYDAVESAKKLERDFYTTINATDVTLSQVDKYREPIETLQESNLKIRLSNDFNDKVKELKIAAEEQRKREESESIEARKRSESESIEQSIQASIQYKEELERQAEESRRLEEERQASIQESLRQESILEESLRQEEQNTSSSSTTEPTPEPEPTPDPGDGLTDETN